MPKYLLDELTQDSSDPSTPIFWETVHWLATQGADLALPAGVQLPEPSLGVQIAELQRSVAIKTPTQLLQVIA